MQIILQEDVEKLGHRGDVVTVKPGYARNFLLPNKLAVEATSGNLKAIERIRGALAKKTATELDAALNAIALGRSTEAIAQLRQFDDRLASTRETGTEATMALRGRGRVLIISEAIAEHGHYFDAGAPA